MARNIKFKKLIDANNFKPELYKELVNRKVALSNDYEKGGELAILRKSLTLLVVMMKELHPELDLSEFEELLEYNKDVEDIKIEVKKELEDMEQSK